VECCEDRIHFIFWSRYRLPLRIGSGEEGGRVTETCKVEGCDRPARYVKACMCQKHNWRFATYGTTDKPVRPEVSRPVKIRVALERGLAQAVEVGECLEWQGFFSCKGATPVVKISNREKHRTENVSVPRLLWERDHGAIPEGKLVYRHCCNNACIAHLACGTRADWAKARKKAGVTGHSPVAKLHLTMGARRRSNVTNTMDKAREVRSLAAARMRTDEISRQTGVSPAMVAEMRQNTAWRELGGSPWQGLAA
jgi:hypothetical protein